MTDLDKLTHEYWGRIRRNAYRMTGNLLDAEDVAQETMLRVIEMGPAFESVAEPGEWLDVASTEAALTVLRDRAPLPLDEFDLPDFLQTSGPGAEEGARPLEGDPEWGDAPFALLFALQYMSPEQRAVLALRGGREDGDRLAARALGVTIPRVYEILQKARRQFEAIRKRWQKHVPFTLLRDDEASAKLFERFREVLDLRDPVLLQQICWPEVELVVGAERISGQDFAAVALAELLRRLGDKLGFTPLWLNGCRGLLCWSWREPRAEWLRVAAAFVLCNGKGVRAMKWFLDGHMLRILEAEEPEPP